MKIRRSVMPMQTVRDVMTTHVVYLPSETTLAEAARTMREQDIGDVVVADEGHKPAGLVTDRDIVVRAVAERCDPVATTVGEIMSRDLVTVRPDDAVPPLPADLADHAGMEQVPECQTPFFLSTRLRPDDTVDLWFDCPAEAPTTRAFAGILAEGLTGATADEVLAVPTDLYQRMGLSTAISPLRVRGGTAILARLQRQVRDQLSVSRATA